MPGDGLQNHLPYLFASGVYATGTHALTWPTEYDAIVMCLYGRVDAGPGVAEEVLADASGNYFVSQQIYDALTASELGRVTNCFTVVPAGTSMELIISGEQMFVNVSGVIVVPTAAALLPT